MRVLVTGGAGFIGSHFIRRILASEDIEKVINVDKLTYAGNLTNTADFSNDPKYQFLQEDILNVKKMVETVLTCGIDTIVNFAAESHVDRSIDRPSAFIDTNVRGTESLLHTARVCEVEKYVQISTDEVYGTLGADGYFTERSPLLPNSPYAASKAAADMFVRSYFETYGLPVNITRCSNNYGPCQHPEKLIPLMTMRALNHESMPVYGDGLNVRDWIHVHDHCRAVEDVMRYGQNGEVYNVGAGEERTNQQIVRLILDYLQRPDSLISYVEDRKGHDRRYAIDPSYISSALGWSPETTFEEGIKETIDWYQQNQTWWQEPAT
ncbi:dTDP-glucose 4,6-dehydratase [Salisediminibacterium halotolerans]|uniref:dTDP-glucose 4,6-dehydratase n=1 Tax=Salisediminibacterium halotolerans TaxID=517425 RepID=A0A1H9VXJ2_9BACI|nr:dTDP-glucose 4,6-dehydratase [Salisediminibacterium haloalkalitolerans]SES26352.1 dTDP-glucose 4,6-dehydratase [Salisediminibacterium haloalkalitolerans]